MDNVEPLAEALVAGFDTKWEVLLDAVTGRISPTGLMPFTLPRDEAAIWVDENNLCASPNDVPGYNKERYMGGRPYDYVDAAGNKYRIGFGLRY